MPPLFPRRVASLQPSATVIIQQLGLLDRLVACTRYCREVCDGLDNRTTLADSWTAQAEQIREVRPDLVIASVPYQEKAIIEILKSGTPALMLAPLELADIYSDILLIAGVLGEPHRSERVIANMKEGIATIRAKVTGCERPRVFCEEWGKPIIQSQEWVAELVEAAGGEFVGEPGKQITAELVLEMNPDVIVAAWCGAGDRVPLEKIVRDRAWQDTAAARNRHIYCVPDEWLNTPAPTLLHGLHALAAAIHPTLFPAPERLKRISSRAS